MRRVAVVALAGVLLLMAQINAVGTARTAFAAPSPRLPRAPTSSQGKPKPSPAQVQQPAAGLRRNRKATCRRQAPPHPGPQQVLGLQTPGSSPGPGRECRGDRQRRVRQPATRRARDPRAVAHGTSAGLDCVDHGTGVAGIIAAAPKQRDPFFGVAPAPASCRSRSRIKRESTPGTLATGIVDAVNDHAQIINVSDQVGNTPALSDAVLYAARKNAVDRGGGGKSRPANRQRRTVLSGEPTRATLRPIRMCFP